MWISVITFLSSVYFIAANNCVNLVGEASRCIPATECVQIANEIQKRGLNDEISSFLQKSLCGWERGVPKICCRPLRSPSRDTNSRNNPTDGVDADSPGDSILPESGQCGRDFINKNRNFGHRIYGGEETQLGEFPWMALLWYRERNSGKMEYKCGGMLINRRFVLTAAHCVTGNAIRSFGSLISVTLGEHDVRNETDCIDNKCSLPPQNIKVLNSYPHENYDEDKTPFDVALIKLARRADYNDFVQPICLNQYRNWKVGDNVIVAGWGRTLRHKSSPVKLKVTLSIANQDQCESKFRLKHDLILQPSQLCIGGAPLIDSCRGDSGGPAMRHNGNEWEAIGVISFGDGCGKLGWPGVYSVVADFHSWILKKMRENTSS